MNDPHQDYLGFKTDIITYGYTAFLLKIRKYMKVEVFQNSYYYERIKNIYEGEK